MMQWDTNQKVPLPQLTSHYSLDIESVDIKEKKWLNVLQTASLLAAWVTAIINHDAHSATIDPPQGRHALASGCSTQVAKIEWLKVA